MNISIEILNKYNMVSLDEYKSIFGDTTDTEKTFYKTFLFQTDDVPKIVIEAQLLNEECDDYTEILNIRKQCREEINRIEAETANKEV